LNKNNIIPKIIDFIVNNIKENDFKLYFINTLKKINFNIENLNEFYLNKQSYNDNEFIIKYMNGY
jgi:hypothetical protein